MSGAQDPFDLLIGQAFSRLLVGDREGAVAIYDQVLVQYPDSATAHHYKGQVLLAQERYEEGWAECEWRSNAAMPPTLPRWKGERLGADDTIFLAGEQGYGDNIHFIRYAPFVAAMGAKVVAGTRAGLGRLISTVPGLDAVVEEGGELPPLTRYVPLMSLPYIFTTRANSIPASIPYMSADPQLEAQWRDRLDWAADGLRIGLVWAGNPDLPGDERRSVGLDAFRVLFQIPGITYFSLQKGGGAKALDGISMPENLFDLGSVIQSFDDTAAIIRNLDLVITVDTAVAHLAGAMGRPVWVVLPTLPDWRWLLDRTDSPWYPTARLFRKEAGEDWPATMLRLAQALVGCMRS